MFGFPSNFAIKKGKKKREATIEIERERGRVEKHQIDGQKMWTKAKNNVRSSGISMRIECCLGFSSIYFKCVNKMIFVSLSFLYVAGLSVAASRKI